MQTLCYMFTTLVEAHLDLSGALCFCEDPVLGNRWGLERRELPSIMCGPCEKHQTELLDCAPRGWR